MSFNPDLIVFVSAFFVPEELYRVLDYVPKIRCVGWIGDDFIANDVVERVNRLDVLYCSDSGFIPKAREFNCRTEFLPLCADPKMFYNKHLRKTLPPFFVGAANAKRIAFLKALKTHCLIYGKGWPDMPQHEVHNKRLTYAESCDFINRSIAPFNLNFSDNNVSGLNFRPFEISACGQPILTNFMPDAERCFESGTEFVAFNSPQDLDRLFLDMAARPEKYLAMADNCYRRTLSEHTFFARAKYMLQSLTDL